ncbi:uncharacterized protein LOC114255608 [Monomorium pharaonis]|uniref:uncharacterized protein LOC114255608 n=1 Tax=Monomorium pharaonis TaxID=307658 RepID=UPI00174686A1|nr:uncharacterized protein LOC114255608 [Monomorium pharaonis]XP_036148962.1 uncharacterized protein LOC114255608 [Monomorium pharaonis]
MSSRFKNMKDMFARNLRLVKELKRSEAGTDSIYKPKWPLFERLMFLKKTCVLGESESNIPSIQLETTNSEIQSTISNFSNEINNSTSCTADVPLNVYYDEALKKFMLVPHEQNMENLDSLSSGNSSSVYSDLDPPATVSTPLPEICLSSQSLSNNHVIANNKRSSEVQLFSKRGSKREINTSNNRGGCRCLEKVLPIRSSSIFSIRNTK